jgi:hypothetical protein
MPPPPCDRHKSLEMVPLGQTLSQLHFLRRGISTAYDSDRLDARLRMYGIELISPHRHNRQKQNTR